MPQPDYIATHGTVEKRHRVQKATRQEEHFKSKANGSFFHSKIIVKVEVTLRTTLQNKNKTQNPHTIEATANSESATTETRSP